MARHLFPRTLIWVLAVALVPVTIWPVLGDHEFPDLIRSVQTALHDQGFDPGPIDGLMGLRTRAALKHLQGEKGLKISGKIDNPTLKQLGLPTHGQGFLSDAAETTRNAGETVVDAGATGAKGAKKGAQGVAATTQKATVSGAKTTVQGGKVAVDTTKSGAKKGAEMGTSGAELAGKSTIKGAKAAARGVGSVSRKAFGLFTGKDNDPSLSKQVESRLQAKLGLSDTDLEVKSKNGTVYITLGAGSGADYDTVTSIAEEVPGVSAVFVRKN